MTMNSSIFSKPLISDFYYQRNKWLYSIDNFLKQLIKNFPLVILLLAVFLSSSFSAGKLLGGKDIELRLEDFLIVIFGFWAILNFLLSGKNKIKKPPLFLPILIWLGFGFISLIINWTFKNVGIWRGFFYFLKELEIFIFYFYFFYQLKNFSSIKFILKIILFLTGINVFYVFYQIIFSRHSGEYGTAALSEWGAFPTGGFFLLLFIFFINLFLYYYLSFNISKTKKIFLGLFISFIPIGIFGSASKTVFIAFIVSLIFILILMTIKNKNYNRVFLFFLFLIIIFSLLITFSEKFPNPASMSEKYRVFDIFSEDTIKENIISGRIYFIKKSLDEALAEKWALLPIIGLGKGYVSEAHNQYVRNFIETGILGSLAFLFLVFVILKKTLKGFLKEKDWLKIGLTAGLFIATLIMLFISLATEPFLVVKVSEVYWIFNAITFAALTIPGNEE